MNIARSSIRIFVANAVSAGIGFIGITFFARELGPHQIGVFFLFQALLGMLEIPADFGISSGVMKRISEGKPKDDVFSTAIILKIIPLSLVIGAIFLFQGYIDGYLGAELSIHLAAALILQEYAKLIIKVLQGQLRVGETAIPLLSRQIAFVGIGLVLVLINFGTLGLVYGFLTGMGVMLAIGAYQDSMTFGRPSLLHVRSLLNYSKFAFISSVGGYFYSWMDIAVIGLILTQSHVGIYEIAWRVTAVVMLFSSAIATTIFPQVSQWDAQEAKERIEILLPKAIAPSLFFVIPAFFGVLLFSRDILLHIFGREYLAGWIVLNILMAEKILQSVHVILGRALQGINRPDLAARAAIIAMLLNLVLNVVLVLQYGIIGAAIATAFSFLVNSLLHAHYLSRFVTIHLPYNQIKGSIVSSLGMVLVLLALKHFVAINSLSRLLAAIFFGVGLYGGFALISPSMRKMIIGNIQRVLG